MFWDVQPSVWCKSSENSLSGWSKVSGRIIKQVGESERTSSNESRSESPLVEKYFMTFVQTLKDLTADERDR